MSLVGVHAGLAATITTILVARSGLTILRRWIVVSVSAVWAIVPDLYHVVPGIRHWYKPLVHDSIVANVFWFHGVLDRLDPHDRALYSVIMITAFLLVFGLTEVWIRRESSRQRTANPE